MANGVLTRDAVIKLYGEECVNDMMEHTSAKRVPSMDAQIELKRVECAYHTVQHNHVVFAIMQKGAQSKRRRGDFVLNMVAKKAKVQFRTGTEEGILRNYKHNKA